MGNPKINDRKLLALIDKEKISQSEVAKRLGVSRQAISKRLQELRGKTTRVVVAKKLEQVADTKIDAMQQVIKINADANELLDLCMAWGRGDDVALRILESQATTRTIRVGDEEIEIQNFKFKDPRELALKAMGTIKDQIKLQLEIFQTLYSLKAAEDFQNTVLEVIGEIEPNVRARIIHKLNEKRAIGSAVKFH